MCKMFETMADSAKTGATGKTNKATSDKTVFEKLRDYASATKVDKAA